MRSRRQNCFLAIMLLSVVGLAQFGCEAEPLPNSVYTGKQTALPAADAEPSDPETPAPETPDRSQISTDELVHLADVSLAENDIETVNQIMKEFRSRRDMSLMTKMDAARIFFATGQMKSSALLYDDVLEDRPEIKPRLWQRGLALYYAEEFEKGVDQFDTHQEFNSQDVENSVWHLLCKSRISSVDEARKSMIQIERDTRIPMKQVFEMFAGKGSPQEVLDACGYVKGEERKDSSIYHGLIYVGLFHEMMGDQEASNNSMKEALKFKPIIPGLMGHVAEGHLRARKAYPVDTK